MRSSFLTNSEMISQHFPRPLDLDSRNHRNFLKEFGYAIRAHWRRHSTKLGIQIIGFSETLNKIQIPKLLLRRHVK